MKILYVDLQYDYGIKDRGLNSIGLDGFKSSMEKLGHTVVPFFYDEYLSQIEKLQDDLLAFAENTSPDLIFFCLFKDQFRHETLQALKNNHTTINWFGDDQWRFESFTRYFANDFSWCVTTDQFSIEKYRSIGQENVIYSQWAAIDAHEPGNMSVDYRHDVTFIGGYHSYRDWFIRQLAKSGVHVEAYGNGWPNGSLSSQEMNQMFQESKVNLNISNSLSYDVRYLLSSARTILQFLRSKKTNSQIKARNFEIPYFGGFQLTDYVPTLENYFNIGNEIACYSSPDEAAHQIKFYLENQTLREQIRLNGQQRAASEHGYYHRLKDILERIK